MPATSQCGVFLTLADPKNDCNFWEYPSFADRTSDWKPYHILGATDHNGVELTPALVNAAAAFAEKYWAKQPAEQINYLGKSPTDTDNNTVGRDVWKNSFKEHSKSWKVLKTVEEVLKRHDCDFTAVVDSIDQPESNEFPTIEEAQVSCHTEIAIALFGRECLLDPHKEHPKLLTPIRIAVKALLTVLWNTYRTTYKREVQQMRRTLRKLDTSWEDFKKNIAVDEKPIQKEQLMAFMSEREKAILLMMNYHHNLNKEWISAAKDSLGDMLVACGLDIDGRDPHRLPPKLLAALKQLASEDQAEQIKASASAMISMIDHGPDSSLLAPPSREFAEPILNWGSGVEPLEGNDMDNLWRMLGLQDTKKIPNFNEYGDTSREKNAWVDRAWFDIQPKLPEGHEDCCETFKPLQIKWHQLVGVVRAIQQYFAGIGCSLNDTTGLGKTALILAVNCVLTFFAEYHEKHNDYPGDFAGKIPKAGDGKIPQLPLLIIVPVTLHAQYLLEIKHFLEPSSYDPVIYTGKYDSRVKYWAEIRSRSKQSPRRLIILATQSAVEDDANLTVTLDSKNKPTVIEWSAWGKIQINRDSSVVGQEYLAVVIDEIHKYRNVTGVSYKAALAASSRACFTIGMTATLAVNSPSDIWNIGRILRIEALSSEEATAKYATMYSDLRKAKAADKKAFLKAKEEEGEGEGEGEEEVKVEVVRGQRILRGQAELDDLLSTYEVTCNHWIAWLRHGYVGYIISRNNKSVDHNGDPILDKILLDDRVLMLQPRQWEKDNLDRISRSLMGESIASVATLQSGSAAGKNFYLQSRRALTHPACNPDVPFIEPKTIEDFEREGMQTAKLAAIVQILQHHLFSDGRTPLRVGEDGKLVVDGEDKLGPNNTPNHSATRDKVVIYMQFPSSNYIVHAVLKLYNIQALEYNGKMSARQRAKILEKFRGEDDIRVLILSDVGAEGLNLQCANIMIKVDVSWSKAGSDQMTGRLHRQGQFKDVIVYRLVLDGTPDVVLERMSFSKGALGLSFADAENNLEPDELYQIDFPASESESEEPKRQPKTKRKPRPKPAKRSRESNAASSNEKKDDDDDDDDEKPQKKRKRQKKEEKGSKKSKLLVESDKETEEGREAAQKQRPSGDDTEDPVSADAETGGEALADLNKQPNAQIDDQTYQFTTVQPLENTDVDLPQATGSSNEEEILEAERLVTLDTTTAVQSCINSDATDPHNDDFDFNDFAYDENMENHNTSSSRKGKGRDINGYTPGSDEDDPMQHHFDNDRVDEQEQEDIRTARMLSLQDSRRGQDSDASLPPSDFSPTSSEIAAREHREGEQGTSNQQLQQQSEIERIASREQARLKDEQRRATLSQRFKGLTKPNVSANPKHSKSLKPSQPASKPQLPIMKAIGGYKSFADMPPPRNTNKKNYPTQGGLTLKPSSPIKARTRAIPVPNYNRPQTRSTPEAQKQSDGDSSDEPNDANSE